jgi:hypothetical protein
MRYKTLLMADIKLSVLTPGVQIRKQYPTVDQWQQGELAVSYNKKNVWVWRMLFGKKNAVISPE